jgi:hypothetical protein
MRCSGFVAVPFLAFSLNAGAADLPGPRLELVLSGTSFEGPPAFTVSVDGRKLGEGVVEAAIESTQDLDINPDVLRQNSQTFRFDLPFGAEPSEVEVTFTNDGWGGEERPYLDRNLYILSMTYEGAQISSDQFVLPDGSSRIDDDIIALFSNTTIRASLPD